MPVLPSLAPRCLSPLKYRQVTPADAGLPSDVYFNSFALICSCGGDDWQVHGYWSGNNELFLGPLAIECTRCAAKLELIDTDKDGHDAEIGDSSASEVAVQGPSGLVTAAARQTAN